MDLNEIQISVWECIFFLYNILIIIYVVLPFVVGFAVVVITLVLSLKFPNIDQPICPTPSPICSRGIGGGINSHAGSAVVLNLQHKQRNEYFIQSVSTLYNNESLLPVWILKDILYDFFKPCTTVAFEQVLVVIPPIQTLYSLLTKAGRGPYKKSKDEQSSICHFTSINSKMETTPSGYDYKGQMERLDRTAATKLTYLDLSLRKYWNSPHNFYKEKRPIYFKFWRDL